MASVNTFAWSPGFLTAHDIGYLLISNNSTTGYSHGAMMRRTARRERYPAPTARDSQGGLAGDTLSPFLLSSPFFRTKVVSTIIPARSAVRNST
jgi:hypothetical protein